jgi:hypothetical protein
MVEPKVATTCLLVVIGLRKECDFEAAAAKPIPL